jgi:hypothetical protein
MVFNPALAAGSATAGDDRLTIGMLRQLSQGLQWVAETATRLSARADRAPIDSVERLFQFVSTRSALITQKKLYGYLKERMGMGYPKMFENPEFAQSIRVANIQIFAASLSDMTVFAVAHGTVAQDCAQAERVAIAVSCYHAGLDDNAAWATKEDIVQWRKAFASRAEKTVWDNVAAGANPFTESPKALIRWAPISDDHKKYDREIVENSMKFAWNEIMQDFRKRVVPAAVVRDWEAGPGEARR